MKGFNRDAPGYDGAPRCSVSSTAREPSLGESAAPALSLATSTSAEDSRYELEGLHVLLVFLWRQNCNSKFTYIYLYRPIYVNKYLVTYGSTGKMATWKMRVWIFDKIT